MTDQLDSNDGAGEGNKQNMMINVNNLNYLLEPDLTVAVNSTYKKHFFNADIYSSTRSAVCILNSGADYLDFRRSYLSFDFALKAYDKGTTTEKTQVTSKRSEAAKWSFGAGGATSLIQRITVQSRSGDEICRIENAALLYHIETNYCYDQEWKETVGSSFMQDPESIAGHTYTHPSQTKKRIHIPLYLLSGFFNYERLMPSMLCSGLRITIDWANVENAIVVTNPSSTADLGTDPTHTLNLDFSYEVSRVELDMKSVQLTDSCQRYLNEVSATAGLEIVYADYNNTIHQIPTNGGEVNMEVRQACSRALKAFARIRSNVERQLYQFDSNASGLWPFSQWQWRLGSLYFPQQPVVAKNVESWKKISLYQDKTDGAKGNSPLADADAVPAYPGDLFLNNSRETYMHALEMFGKSDPNGPRTSVSYDMFINNGYVTGTTGVKDKEGTVLDVKRPHAIIPVNLERSTIFSLSGVPINNSRVLSLQATIQAGGKTSGVWTSDQVGNTTGSYVGTHVIPEGSTYNHTADIFLQYVKLARVFLNNVEIEQ